MKKIEPTNQASIKVTFGVEQYIDEKVSVAFEETYIFHYGNTKTIERVGPEGKNENIAETLPLNAQQLFEEFGSRLIKTIETKETAITLEPLNEDALNKIWVLFLFGLYGNHSVVKGVPENIRIDQTSIPNDFLLSILRSIFSGSKMG
ncbi:hypothetical protein [Niabella ginsengisoli]|uniref:Uncharacterized protein n=1 Tax=Niabella ginsengisoli TaxID=522298 RepID=A0ABS9SGK1_9BACT|nr:hypothetical protein [Niabella ginsengisoli]MCH5597488.1 hypothetical protein [Niabella ginsengisoli]